MAEESLVNFSFKMYEIMCCPFNIFDGERTTMSINRTNQEQLVVFLFRSFHNGRSSGESSSRFQRSNHLDHRQCMDVVQIFSMYNRLTRFLIINKYCECHQHMYMCIPLLFSFRPSF